MIAARDPAGLGRWWCDALGDSRVDVEQGDDSWIVLADPEGNEFCVLGERRA